MNKVTTEQKFIPRAKTWNSFIDAALYVKGKQTELASQTLKRDTKSGIVLVRNSTDEGLNQFVVVSLGDLIITPENNEQEFRSNLPVFELIKDELSNPFGILQKPLKKDEVGSAILSGITPVRLNILSETHEFAELDENGLKSSDSGSIRILWKESGTGEKWAVTLLGSSGASAYNGYFAASNSSDEEAQNITVSNGVAIINNELKNVYEDEITIASAGYVYLDARMSADTLLDPTIEFAEDFPVPTDGSFKAVIAVVEWDSENEKITKITQQQYGVIYGIIWGECA